MLNKSVVRQQAEGKTTLVPAFILFQHQHKRGLPEGAWMLSLVTQQDFQKGAETSRLWPWNKCLEFTRLTTQHPGSWPWVTISVREKHYSPNWTSLSPNRCLQWVLQVGFLIAIITVPTLGIVCRILFFTLHKIYGEDEVRPHQKHEESRQEVTVQSHLMNEQKGSMSIEATLR